MLQTAPNLAIRVALTCQRFWIRNIIRNSKDTLIEFDSSIGNGRQSQLNSPNKGSYGFLNEYDRKNVSFNPTAQNAIDKNSAQSSNLSLSYSSSGTTAASNQYKIFEKVVWCDWSELFYVFEVVAHT